MGNSYACTEIEVKQSDCESVCVLYLNRGGSRGTSNNCEGEQNSNYLPRKTKLKIIFALLHRCSTYLKSASETWCSGVFCSTI